MSFLEKETKHDMSYQSKTVLKLYLLGVHNKNIVHNRT